MILSGTTDTLEITTTSSANTDVIVDYATMDDTTKEVTVGSQETAISSATTTAVCAAPGAGLSRKAKWISIANRHASTAQTVTLLKDVSTTDYTIDSFTLAAGERASWTDSSGMTVFDAEGRVKIVPIPIGSVVTTRLAATVTNATTTAAKITGLDTSCSSGTYVFEYFLRAQSATTSVGFKLSNSYSGTATTFDYIVFGLTAGTLDSTGVFDQSVTAPSVLAAMGDRAESTAAILISTAGVDTVNVDQLLIIEGLMVCTTTGNLELYHASETATNTSIMLDSCLRLTKVA